MITYIAAKPFNSNHVFTRRLNRTVATIGLSKNQIMLVPKVYSNINLLATYLFTIIDYCGSRRQPGDDYDQVVAPYFNQSLL